ncbi:MAG TPA: STAS domain-containing protein [Streptosporangiaceae bacterium]|nr:STAS domain-containing protein [Streptosporangiaceae bacterium]
MPSQVDLVETVGTTVIAITGELDSSSSTPLRDRLMALIPDSGQVRLDLSGLTYISSAGLRTLLLVYRRATSRGTQVTLTGIQDEVWFVMSATGFLNLFDVEGKPEP